MFSHLWETYRIPFFLTSRLNQDCIENLFSSIRGKGGHRDNPDSVQFRSALQQCMVDKLILSSNTKNCKDDIDSFLFGLQSITTAKCTPKSNQQQKDHIISTPDQDEYQNVPSLLDIQESNVLAYIAGYIFVKTISPKLCQPCAQSLVDVRTSHEHHLFIANKQYSESCKLHIPSELVMNLSSELEHSYTSVCESMLHKDPVKASLIDYLMQNATVLFPSCSSDEAKCNIVLLFSKLFVTIRPHHSLRESNRNFCVANTKRNRKVLKLSHV